MDHATSFRRISNIIPGEFSGGWDEKASEYARLPETNGIYRLTKELLYRIIDEDIMMDKDNSQVNVLDFNCGCGNDFPFFLEKGWYVTGCDGSSGMLNVAIEKYHNYLESGKINLYLGRSEEMIENSFMGKKI